MGLVQFGPMLRPSPGPGVSEPDRGQQSKAGCFRSAIRYRNFDENVLGAGLRVFHKYIEISIVVECACIEQFELCLILAALPVLLDQLAVGKRCLGILVEVLHVGMRWRRVEIEVVLLHILAVITFISCQAKKSLFQDWIMLVPKSYGKAD